MSSVSGNQYSVISPRIWQHLKRAYHGFTVSTRPTKSIHHKRGINTDTTLQKRSTTSLNMIGYKNSAVMDLVLFSRNQTINLRFHSLFVFVAWITSTSRRSWWNLSWKTSRNKSHVQFVSILTQTPKYYRASTLFAVSVWRNMQEKPIDKANSDAPSVRRKSIYLKAIASTVCPPAFTKILW